MTSIAGFRWQNEYDVANRSTVHTATPDYLYIKGLGDRRGWRVLSVGERPYLDPDATGCMCSEGLWGKETQGAKT